MKTTSIRANNSSFSSDTHQVNNSVSQSNQTFSSVLFQRKLSEEENEIDKQEQEIIESLEREVKEKHLQSILSGMHI